MSRKKRKIGSRCENGEMLLYCHHDKSMVRAGDCWPCAECEPCSGCTCWPCPFGEGNDESEGES